MNSGLCKLIILRYTGSLQVKVAAYELDQLNCILFN
jgi:hypothetical protein